MGSSLLLYFESISTSWSVPLGSNFPVRFEFLQTFPTQEKVWKRWFSIRYRGVLYRSVFGSLLVVMYMIPFLTVSRYWWFGVLLLAYVISHFFNLVPSLRSILPIVVSSNFLYFLWLHKVPFMYLFASARQRFFCWELFQLTLTVLSNIPPMIEVLSTGCSMLVSSDTSDMTCPPLFCCRVVPCFTLAPMIQPLLTCLRGLRISDMDIR